MGDIRRFLNPKRIAVIGASEEENSLSRIAMENLINTNNRDVFPVNPNRDTILGLKTYASIRDIKEHVDLAIIVVRAEVVPEIVEECGMSGVDGAIIISSGFSETGEAGAALERRIKEARKKYGIRIIGPNSMGIIRPNNNLNATIIKDNPDKGKTAFISQSGAFGRALLDWGMTVHMGFSMFASLGNMVDVDFADLIDFLAQDPYTRNIMLYVEGDLGDLKRFISAAKGFARNKPILVLKPERSVIEDIKNYTHTGVLVNEEAICDAIFKRTGVVRVKGAIDLFDCASVLYAKHLPRGPRLLVITNAKGVGIMAINTLIEFQGEVASLSQETLDVLDKLLPPYVMKENPLDLLRDADVERYRKVLDVCLKEPGADGVLVIFTPQGDASPDKLAESVVDASKAAWKPIVATWMGGKKTEIGKDILLQNSIPTYNTPEEAVKTYLYMYHYRRNLGLLYETPAELPVDSAPPKNNLKAFIKRIACTDKSVLSEVESMRFLTNYGIPTMKVQLTQSAEEAVIVAKEVGYPVVLKVSSPDIVFRVDVGGVVLGINSEGELKEEYGRLLNKVKAQVPQGKINGILVQKMLDKIDYEVIIGAKKDRKYGSVILFGMGGIGVQMFRDFAVGLPPLNQTLARRLIEESRVYKMLLGYRNRPPADLRQLEQILVSFSNLIVDFPEIGGFDINPVAISNGKAYALDARIVIDKECIDSPLQYPHLLITPYPTRYITQWTLKDGTNLILRPIKPEDEPLLDEMYTSVSEETFRSRFFQSTKNTSHEMHIRQCNIDYDREMGIVVEQTLNDKRRIVGIGTLISEAANNTAEYAVLIHDDFQGKGLGYKLVDLLIGIAQERGLDEIYGIVLSSNKKMLSVCKKLGFNIEPMADGLTKTTMPLK